MIGVLLRKDPAVRALPPLILAGGVLGAISVVSVGKILEQESEVWKSLTATLSLAPLMQVLFLSWIAAIGSWAGVRERVGEMHLVLPVPLRTWIGLRVTALLLVGWLPLAITCAAVLLGVRVPEARHVMLTAGGASALSWGAWVAACFAWRPQRPRLDSLPVFLVLVAAGLGLAWTSLLFPPTGAVLSLVVLVAAATLAWRGIPAVMELEGVAASGSRAGDELVAEAPPQAARRSLRTWVARRTWRLGRNVVLLLASTLMTFFVLAGDGGLDANLFFAIFFAGMVVAHSTRVLRDVAHLPLSRRSLAPGVLLPSLLALLIGFGLSVLPRHLDPGTDWAQEVDLRQRRGASEEGTQPAQRVAVPGALLEVTLGSRPRVVTAPWGESASLEPEPLLPGLPLAFVNPYDITPQSSIDFVAWQLSRAVRDAYGVRVEPEALRDSYLSVLQGRVIGPFFDQRFLDDHPEVQETFRPGLAGWGISLVVLGWLLAGWRATLPNVPAADRRGWRRARAWMMAFDSAVGVAFLAVAFLPFAWRSRLPGLQDAFAAALFRAVGGREWVLPVCALALAVVGYAWMTRRFERLEVPPALKRAWYQAPE